MTDIPPYSTFVKIEPIEKGLSKDKKYYIETADGQRLLLRISATSEYDRIKTTYERIAHISKHGIPMPRSVDFGICENGDSVYQLLTWCDGSSLWRALGTMFIVQESKLAIYCEIFILFLCLVQIFRLNVGMNDSANLLTKVFVIFINLA